MGQNHIYGNSLKTPIKMCRNFFDFQYVIGKGGFGKVWRVVFKKNQRLYALKEMSKVKVIDKKSEKSIKGEREILSQFHHPFIINMVYAFQDYENLYLIMDLLTGGDLRYHISKYRRFSEAQTRCLLHGLEYIHGKEIIHRDIKPENLVCDSNGYIRITDFGVSKKNMPDNSSETSGTPGYMAPEVLMSQNHSYPVDFYAIGVMGYEFMMGQRPYLGKSRKEIRQAVLAKQEKIEEKDIIKGWSKEAADFINKCLQRKAERRLGFHNGVKELKEHSWFKGFNWEALANKTMPSPFIPKAYGNYDKKYCERIDKLSPETIERYQNYMKREDFVSLFENYTFFNLQSLSELDNPKKVDGDTNTAATKNTCTKGSTNVTNNNATMKDDSDKNKANISNVQNAEVPIKKENKYMSFRESNCRLTKPNHQKEEREQSPAFPFKPEVQHSPEKLSIDKLKFSKISQPTKINPKKISHNSSFLKKRWDNNDFNKHFLDMSANRPSIINNDNSNINGLNNENDSSFIRNEGYDKKKIKKELLASLRKNEERQIIKKGILNDNLQLPLLKPSGSAQNILEDNGERSVLKLKLRDSLKFGALKKSYLLKNKIIGFPNKHSHRNAFVLKKSDSVGDMRPFYSKKSEI